MARLAVRSLGVEAACFVPAGEAQPVWAGALAQGEIDLAGLRGLVTGVVVVAEDTADAPVLAALMPAARFFASIPVVDGRRRIGALCLFGEAPRSFTPEDQQALAELAALAAELTEASGPGTVEPGAEREPLFRFMFEQGDQFVGLLSPEGRLLEVNPSALAFGGLRREEVVGQPFWACPWFARVPESVEVVRAAVERAASGERVRLEVEVGRGDGRPATVALSISPVLAEDGSVRYLVPEGRDVSRLKRLEAELRAQHTELERIFFASPDAIIFTDPDRVIQKVSAAAARLFGYEPGALVGQSVRQLYAHEGDYERQGQLRFRPDAAEQIEPFRAEWRRKDGSAFLGEVVGVPVHDAEGEHIGYLGIIRDVTAQEQAVHALRERETLLRSVIENTPVVLYALDAEGVFTLYEGQGLRAVGHEPGQVVGRALREVYAEKPEVIERNERVLAGETGRWVSEVGGRFYETHAAPFFGEDGAITGMIGVGVDVTERIRAEEALREATRRAESAQREAEQAAEFKSAFLASMSHEIRTPLTGVLGFAEILTEVLPEEYREPARMIEMGGRQLLDTINSVLDFARLEAAQVEVRALPVNVVDLVEEAVALLRPLARSKDLILECSAVAPPAHVRTDPALLTRIVNNLVGNAIKFTRSGGVTVEVRGEETGWFTLRVCDTGAGIAPEFLPHLFEAFRQGDRPKGEQQGSGLGLAITKRLVELMGGEIEVESELGAGSAFTVRLPRTVAQPEPVLAANSL